MKKTQYDLLAIEEDEDLKPSQVTVKNSLNPTYYKHFGSIYDHYVEHINGQPLARQHALFASIEDIGAPSLNNVMTSIGGYCSSFMSKFLSIFESPKLIPCNFTKSDMDRAVTTLQKLKPVEIEPFTVIVPEYVKGDLLPYLSTLSLVFADLSTVETRFLIPLEQWAGNILTDPSFAEKVWLNLPKKDNTVEKYTNELHQYFNESHGDGTSERKFHLAYGNAEGVKKVDEVLTSLSAQALKLMDGKLSKRAKSVSELMFRIHSEKNEVLKTITQDQYQYVSDLVYAAAQEMELLAIVLFQIRVATYAHKESLEKINKQLA